MSGDQILDDINALRNNVDVFGRNLSQEITKLTDQINESERENVSLIEKATNLSNQIIKQQKIKSQLLFIRHKLISGTQDRSDVLLTTQHAEASSSQTKDDESQQTILESSIPATDAGLGNHGILKSPEGGIIRILDTSANVSQPQENQVTEIEPLWLKPITEGFEHFNLTRKQTIKTLAQLLPENLNEFKLKTKLQVKGLTGQKISCSAGQNEVIVLVTEERLYASYYRAGQFVSMKLETIVLCVDVQTRDVAIIGSECGQLSLVSINEQQIEEIHKYRAAVTGVKVHPNGGFAVLILASGEWSLVDILDRKVLRTQETQEIISGFDIHPNGAYLATCAYLGSVTFWDLRLPSAIQHIRDKEFIGVKHVKFLIHGNWLCLRTSTTTKLLDTAKFPTGTSNLNISSTGSPPLMDADPSGRVVCCTANHNIRILTTFRKVDGKKLNGLHEVKCLDTVGQVIYLKFVDDGVIVMTEIGEIELYHF